MININMNNNNVSTEIDTIKKRISKIVKNMYRRFQNNEYYSHEYKNQEKFIDSLRIKEKLNMIDDIYTNISVCDDFDDELIFVFEEDKPVVKSCLCTNIIGNKKVCTRNICTFAHYEDEWNPEVCKFNMKCSKKNSCQRLHGNETKADACKRLGIVFLSKKKYVNQRFHTMQFLANKKSQTSK